MEMLVAKLHLHPIIDHFTIALLVIGVLADIFASAISMLFRNRLDFFGAWSDRLKGTALQLIILGAVAAVLSHWSGESEAERVWDTISPAAQALLFSDTGAGRFLSHAVLGTYLMYAFLTLAAWRISFEVWVRVAPTRPLYLLIAAVSLAVLLYQGKTGGELVYDHAVGTAHSNSATEQSTNNPN